MILRKVAMVVGTISIALGIASCKGGSDAAQCCTFTDGYGVTYYACEGGNLFINGVDSGFPVSIVGPWSDVQYYTAYYGGTCS